MKEVIEEQVSKHNIYDWMGCKIWQKYHILVAYERIILHA